MRLLIVTVLFFVCSIASADSYVIKREGNITRITSFRKHNGINTMPYNPVFDGYGMPFVPGPNVTYGIGKARTRPYPKAKMIYNPFCE